MFTRLRKTAIAAAALAAVSFHGGAAADVMFTGSGTWAGDAAITSLSAPSATWSFAFTLPSALAASTTSAIGKFSYQLAGVSSTALPSAITFYAAADGGMFDIAFGDTSPSLSLYGDAVLAEGGFAIGNYAVFAGISGGQSVGSGSVVLVPAPVPEPATWALIALGFAGIAARRRRVAPAAGITALAG